MAVDTESAGDTESAERAGAARRPVGVLGRLAGLLRWMSVRHHLAAELLLVVGLYAAYDLGRGAALTGTRVAVAHARSAYRLEEALHIAVEGPIQRASLAVPGLTVAFGIGYLALHILLTGIVLLWLYWRHPEGYVTLRNALLVASVLALVGFVVWPTAPPRLAGIDIAGTLSRAGVALNSPTLTLLYNPYAAFPSLHEAYAAVSAYGIRRHAPNRAVWAAGALLPVWVAVEVIATGNHFVVDVVAGVVVAELGLLAARRLDSATGSQRSPANRSSSGSSAPLRSKARTNHSRANSLP
ncbi:MAG: phosphatase PAP2 family protein [Actinomycetota bacterium]|nr:phosphatase PAP2 family protein [Actinomycetota bacterium]